MNNLKPFSLPGALSGKAVMLRNGEKAFVRHHETEHLTEIDDALLGYREGVCSWSWCVDGASSPAGVKSGFDIIGMFPETRVINGFEVPAPETEELEHGTAFYLASPLSGQLYEDDLWAGYRDDKFRLERGLLFLNKEDAIATAKAMLGIDPYEGDES